MDAKEQKKLYVVLGLAVVLVGLAVWRFAPRGRAAAASSAAPSAAVAGTFNGEELRAELDRHAAKRTSALQPYEAPRRDPFARPGLPELARDGQGRAGGSSLRLQAVIRQGTNSIASISGSFYKVGDEVGAHRLISITGTSAVLEANGEVLTLYQE